MLRYIKFYPKKGNKAAWFVSNCHSRSGREKKVAQLKKLLSVDVFGSSDCSDPGLTCDRKQDQQCLQMLNTTYKVGTEAGTLNIIVLRYCCESCL